MKRLVGWPLLVLCCVCAVSAVAEVRLPALFSDGMVLQRDAPVKVWGWSDAEDLVTVALDTQEVSAKPKDGRWEATLGPLQAGGPFSMTVRGENTLVVKDVLVGEVWVCGGQSNMAFTVERATDAEATVAAADHPSIRLFQVPTSATDEPAADVDAAWQVCSPDSVGRFSAVGYNFGLGLHAKLGVPIGLIQSCVGGTNVSSWIPREVMLSDPEFRHFVVDWDAAVAAQESAPSPEAAPRRPGLAPPSADNPKRPAGFYSAMIRPLQPYTIKGAIWYQGEANAKSADTAIEYRRFFPAMIRTWREHWGQGPFPFLFVQLAGYGKGDAVGWPMLREAQTMTLSLENTGMAVAIDVGMENDIHPKDKKTVGERLVQSGLAVAYGRDVEPSGPLYKEMSVEGNQAMIGFKHVGEGLMVKGDRLEGFVVAGKDRHFVPADARVSGQTVVVSSPEVAKPEAVRYAWASYGPCNLYSKNGLPAVPFRTDDWAME